MTPTIDSPNRLAVLEHVCAMIPRPVDGRVVRVAVDGGDGAGKTFFADELAVVVRADGRPAIRVSVDDFHHSRSVRYQRGRGSPEGFWFDSFDYERFRSFVLDPLGPGGSGWYRPVGHDLESDTPLFPDARSAVPGSVLVVDGLFLHRDELVRTWDFSIFLRVPFDVTAARMAVRDGTDPDPDHPGLRRYVEGQRLYFKACSPWERATVVIDNTDLTNPLVC